MDRRSITVLAVAVAVLGGSALIRAGDLRLPGDHTGFAPEQPIRFSHRLHAGELQVACLYCHPGAEKSRHAGIPEASLCMNCHKVVTAPFEQVAAERALAVKEGREARPIVSPEIAKLDRALALGPDRARDPAQEPRPIEWVRVHQLPDFVYFDHRPHVLRGLACETCHGPVQAMERVRQEASLSMGWCVACHRANDARHLADDRPLPPGSAPPHVPTDCVTCHF